MNRMSSARHIVRSFAALITLVAATFATPAFAVTDTETCTFDTGITTCTVVTTREERITIPFGSFSGSTDDGSVIARLCGSGSSSYEYTAIGPIIFDAIFTIEQTTTIQHHGAPESKGKVLSQATIERDMYATIDYDEGSGGGSLSINCTL